MPCSKPGGSVAVLSPVALAQVDAIVASGAQALAALECGDLSPLLASATRRAVPLAS